MTEDEKQKQQEEINVNQIMLSASRSKLDYQLNADNGLDSKAGVVLALEGAFAIFYLEIIGGCINVITIIPLVLLVASGVYLWNILTSKEYNTGVIDFFDDSKGYRVKSEKELSLQLLSDYQEAFEANNIILEKKNLDYKEALKLLLVSITLIVIFYIF